VNPFQRERQRFAELMPLRITQWRNVYVFVGMMLFAKENRILLKVLTQDECYSATVKDSF